jgi:hypothetical protein
MDGADVSYPEADGGAVGGLDSKANLPYKHSLGMLRKGQLTFFGNSQTIPLPCG